MKFKLISNRMLSSDNKFAGYNNENRAELLEFVFPENLKDYTKTINFRTPDGNFFDILDGDTYTLKNNITKYDKVYFYIEFKKQISETEYEVIKTEVKTLNFNSSFNVDKEISEEEINILDKLIVKIDEIDKRVTYLEEHGGGGGGASNIDDVQVDGVSVVKNKIANIELRKAVIDILVEYGLIKLESLTEEQRQALNEMECTIDENGELSVTYDETVLNIDFQVEDGNLIIDNNINATFNINENGELEVNYE